MGILKSKQWKIEEQENGEFYVFETVNNQLEDVDPIFEWELSGCLSAKKRLSISLTTNLKTLTSLTKAKTLTGF